ncbi:MAG TPA: hypothetical protein VNK81_07635 [Thermodesulfobacteriota bacterium]|jgi:hypothetical protein|nr:hypothetical protein [Thermodesulfobacteriota bacterium]
MVFSRVIYEVIQVDRLAGLIRVKDKNGERSEIIVETNDNIKLLTDIREGDVLEVEVKGWRIGSIRKIDNDIHKDPKQGL